MIERPFTPVSPACLSAREVVACLLAGFAIGGLVSAVIVWLR